ncbi:hypothetical protein ACF1BS_03725 [Streptomyces sp. NPDC014748]|uniref:hypothetical protein n=1 Tax=Streptomyces sp. NPDC014748 TaxID=3364905 RepID=UPI0036FB89BB
MKPVSINQQRPTGPVVWILSQGEDHEGGTVLGVYASKEAAKGPFAEAARNIPFDLDAAWQDDDGAVHAHGGCDWVSLKPHQVVTQLSVEAGTR